MSVFSDLDITRQENEREQIDPTYLAALQELAKVSGMSNLLVASKFTAAVFGKTLADVVKDACDATGSFGQSVNA